MKIVHIITGLGDGGAEHTLFKICKYDTKNNHIVISLKGPGKYFSLLSKIGIKVYCINFHFFSIPKFFFLIKILRSLRPNLVQTWLVHADFLGSIAARIAGIDSIVWNVRYSNIQIGKAKLTTIMVIRLLSILSYFLPQKILTVSKKAKKIYEGVGYKRNIFKFIPNGYDLSILKINNGERIKFKKKNKLQNHVSVIGNVARYDPQKDHFNLLKALSLIRSKNLNFVCILVGYNMNKNNVELTSEIKKLKLSNYVKLLGQSNKISQVMNGIDIHVLSSSYGEGFPNVVAEAMSCGTPCIVTDVGDSAFVVGKNGWIVPPRNVIKLTEAIEKALKEKNTKKWNKRCNRARLRIKEKFSISKMITLYNNEWIKVYNKNKKNKSTLKFN